MQRQVEDVLLDLGAALEIAVATTTSSSRVVHIATISPVGAMMQLCPMRSQPSSRPAFATPTTQAPFW